MKLLYKPFAFMASIVAAVVSRKAFDAIWAHIDEDEAPKATHQDAPIIKILSAAALQGIVFRGTKAAMNHYGARGFYYLTGTWPGPEPPPKDQA